MHFLYATDDSPGAHTAADLLNALPLEKDDTVTILTVVPHDRSAESHDAVAAARAAMSHSPVGLTTLTRTGDPAHEILQSAEEQPPDLIVMGASGRSALARFFIGSVADRVVRHALVPVLIARPLRGELRETVVGVDGSPAAERAVSWLGSFPLPSETRVRLLTVLPRLEDLTRTSRFLPLPLMAREDATTFIEREREDAQAALDEQAAAFSAAGRTAVTETRRGDPASGLIEAAEEGRADLIVVGSHGHSAIERFMMGSVSERLIRHAACSVLIVR